MYKTLLFASLLLATTCTSSAQSVKEKAQTVMDSLHIPAQVDTVLLTRNMKALIVRIKTTDTTADLYSRYTDTADIIASRLRYEAIANDEQQFSFLSVRYYSPYGKAENFNYTMNDKRLRKRKNPKRKQ